MKILVIGARGQLGSDLLKRLRQPERDEIVASSRTPAEDWLKLDVTDREQVFEILRELRPGRIFNCAAFHNVDECEDGFEQAFRVNAFGVCNLADAAREIDAEVIHFSTDYVFDGRKGAPYVESDLPDPLSAYGTSKLAGELLLRRRLERHFIFRVSGLYGAAGSAGKGGNFVETMLRLGREKGAVRVVDDQSIAPTFTADLADKLVKVVKTGRHGLYHLVSREGCSWYEFACEIFRLAHMDVDCRPQSTAESGRKAQRPAYSVLASERLEKTGISPIRSWRDALPDYLREKGHI